MLLNKSCLITVATFFFLFHSSLSDARRVFHRVKPHLQQQTVATWPFIRVEPLLSDDPEIEAAAKGEEPSTPEKPHPAENTKPSKIAKQAITKSEEEALDRQIDALAHTAESLSNILKEKEHTYNAEKQAAIEAAKQAEESEEQNALENALEAQTEAEDIADKAEMAEKEDEIESKERMENEVAESKLIRAHELEEDKELIQEAKEKAEAEVAKKAATDIEKRAEKEAQRVLEEEEKVEEASAEATEAQGLMEEKARQKKLVNDINTEARAVTSEVKAEDSAQRELEHRKNLQAKAASVVEQEKLKEEAPKVGIPGRCSGITFLQNCHRSGKSISARNARSFLRSLQRLGHPTAIKQEDAEVSPLNDYASKDKDNVEEKAVVAVPKEEGEKEEHGEAKEDEKKGEIKENEERHGEGRKHNKEGKGSLSASQWVYLAVIFPAGVTLAALSLILFV